MKYCLKNTRTGSNEEISYDDYFAYKSVGNPNIFIAPGGSNCNSRTPAPPSPPPPGPPPPGPPPGPPPPPPVSRCDFPSTPFRGSMEGNKFRQFVNDNFNDLARDIDLDRRGKHNNCYIREAYATTPSGYALSAGEIFVQLQADPNQTLDNFTTANYSKFKSKQKEDQTYSSDSQMWQDLVDRGEIYNGGEIKRLKGGSAVYIVKYDKSTNKKVAMDGNETSDIEGLIPEMETFEYVALLPPSSRNTKPLKGEIGILTLKKDVNDEDYIAIVKEKGSKWTAFDKGMTFDEMNESKNINERIIGKIINLIKEEGEGDGIDRSGKNKTADQNKPADQNQTQTQTACVITPEQKVDLDGFLAKNKDAYEGMTQTKSADGKSYTLTANEETAQDIGQYTIIKLKELKYNDNRQAIRNPETISDSCIAYKRTTIQNTFQDQVKTLETWLNGKGVNLTTTEPEFGGKTGAYPLKLVDIIPELELAKFRLQEQGDLTVYIKDPTKVKRTSADCRDAVKNLYACMAGKKGGGVLQCGSNNIKAIVDNKISAYFCTALVRGEGKFWTNLGLGKEFSYIKDDAGQSESLFSIKNMVEDSPLRESRLSKNIKNTIMETIRNKKNTTLSESIKKGLIDMYKKQNF